MVALFCSQLEVFLFLRQGASLLRPIQKIGGGDHENGREASCEEGEGNDC